MLAQLPDAITAALWALVAFAVLVVVRAIVFGLREVRGLAETVRTARERLGEAQVNLEQDRTELAERITALRSRTEKDA